VLVDDGSQDRSWSLIQEQHARDPRFRGLRLSRNFGHQLALTAGLDRAGGDAVVVMDADLQDPPEVVLELIARWREGHAVVYGQRRSRAGEGWFKLVTARAFYRLMQWLSPSPTPLDVGDFYLLDRQALDQLRSMRERHRYLRGMVFWLGFSRVGVPYDRHARHAGRTKFNLGRMLRFAMDGALSSSSAPLTLASYVGLAAAGLGLLLGLWAVWEKLTDPSAVIGWASTVVIVLFLGGVQLATIGILGLYVGRVYDEAKRRPLYLVQQDLGGENGEE
jgi:glycosyltransferase involved in cell wall biosynthesis